METSRNCLMKCSPFLKWRGQYAGNPDESQINPRCFYLLTCFFFFWFLSVLVCFSSRPRPEAWGSISWQPIEWLCLTCPGILLMMYSPSLGFIALDRPKLCTCTDLLHRWETKSANIKFGNNESTGLFRLGSLLPHYRPCDDTLRILAF